MLDGAMRDLDIRRSDLRGVRRSGTVRCFKDDKGYGRITADDGEVLFVHSSAIVGQSCLSLEMGQRVAFVWHGGMQDHARHCADEVRVATARDGRHAHRPATEPDHALIEVDGIEAIWVQWPT